MTKTWPGKSTCLLLRRVSWTSQDIAGGGRGGWGRRGVGEGDSESITSVFAARASQHCSTLIPVRQCLNPAAAGLQYRSCRTPICVMQDNTSWPCKISVMRSIYVGCAVHHPPSCRPSMCHCTAKLCLFGTIYHVCLVLFVILVWYNLWYWFSTVYDICLVLFIIFVSYNLLYLFGTVYYIYFVQFMIFDLVLFITFIW